MTRLIVAFLIGAGTASLGLSFVPKPEGVVLYGDWGSETVSENGHVVSTHLFKKDCPANVRLDGWVDWRLEPKD